MKRLSLTVFFCVSLLIQLCAQKSVEQVFQKNDIAELTKLLPKTIELSIEDEENIYSKQQAIKVIEKFFNEYPSSGFSIKHESKANKSNNNKFVIGEYLSHKKRFRTHFLISQVKDKVQIIEIRIESEDN